MKHNLQIFFLFFFCLAQLNGKAQVIFQKSSNSGVLQSVETFTEVGSTSFIFTGSASVANGVAVSLLKMDGAGNISWSKSIDTSGSQWGNSVKHTFDGGFIITGAKYDSTNSDVYLVKTDQTGNVMWSKTFGGNGQDEGWCVRQTSDSGYIVVGITNSFGAGSNDIYLIRTDVNGDTLWTKTYGGISSDLAYSVYETIDGGFIVGGSTLSFGSGIYDAYLIKTNASGNVVWSKTYGGINNDHGRWVEQTFDTGYIFVGYTSTFTIFNNEKVYLIKTDPGGAVQWSKSIGGLRPDNGYCVHQTTDSGYIITGVSRSFNLGNNMQVYLVKTDANGNVTWSYTYCIGSDCFGLSSLQTADGGYFIAAYTYTAGLGAHPYLIKTDAFGNSGCNETPATSTVATAATILTTPFTIVTSPSTSANVIYPSVIPGDSLIDLCYSVGLEEILEENLISVYPNPTKNNFIIKLNVSLKNAQVEIYNLLGEKYFEEIIRNTSSKEIHLENLSAGIYLVKLNVGERQFVQKIVIE